MAEPKAAMEQALELAREAADAGDEPFGSVLVYGGQVVNTARNTVESDGDPTAHPELKLARWAGRNLSPEERAQTTMYTSTEPCAMCAGGIRTVGLGRVVFSTSGPVLAAITGGEAGPRAVEIVGDRTAIDGPLLPEGGRAIHEKFW